MRAERILLVSTLYPPNVLGGAEVVVQILAEGLATQGHEVCVATLRPRGAARERRVAGVQVKEFELRHRPWPFSGRRLGAPRRLLWHVGDNFDPAIYGTFKALLDSFAPTIVNTHNINGFTPAVWLAARRAGRPVLVHTCHDYGLLCSRTTMFARGRSCASLCPPCRALTSGKRLMAKLVDGAVGVSEAVIQPHVERGVFRRDCARRVIYNAQPLGEPVPRTVARAGPPLKLGFMGRLSADKGIALLYEELGRLGPAVSLAVAGRGDTGLVDRLAARHSVASARLGFIEPRLFYRDVDVLVVPSLWRDPLPTVVLEAFRHGVPVVAADRGGLPELVQQGVNGLIFDPARPGDLARALRRLLDEPDLLPGLRARARRSVDRFTVERMVANYLAFYEEAALARHAPAEARVTP